MGKLDEEILMFLRRNGPSTPIDIAQKMGVNSIIITAVLVDAMSQDKIMRSKRKIGSSKYFFFPEHLQMLQKKIADNLSAKEREVLQKLLKENILGEFELKPDEVATLSELEDLIGGFVMDFGGTPVRCWYSPDMDEAKARQIVAAKMQEKFGVPKPAAVQLRAQDQKIVDQLAAVQERPAREIPKVAQHAEKAAKAKVEKLDKFDKAKAEKKAGKKKKEAQQVLAVDEALEKLKEHVYNWLEKNSIDVATEKTLKAGKELELQVKVPNPFGKQTYLVRILNTGKKPASQEDVSSIGMAAIARRIPVIIISETGFAKNAKKYWEKELEDIVFLMSKDDLD